MLLAIALSSSLAGYASAESQCTARRVPSNECALLYFDWDCGGRAKEIADSLSREALRRTPRNVIVRPGCKFVGMFGEELYTQYPL